MISASENEDNGVQATGITTQINSFICPSSTPARGTFDYGPNTDNPNLTWINPRNPGNNYFASVGPTVSPWTSANPPGIFAICSPGAVGSAGIRDVTDGTSNTIAFGEWRMGDFDSNKLSIQDAINLRTYTVAGFGDWSNQANSSMPRAGMTNFTTFLQTCAGAAKGSVGTNNNKSYVGRDWNQGMFGHTLGTTLLPPNSQYPNCNLEPWGGDFDAPSMLNLSSFHPGGANVAFADGSVRFIKSSASWMTIWSLGSKAGGEVLSADSY